MTIPANVNKLGKQFAGKTPNLKTLTVKTGKLKAGGIAGKAFTGMGSSKTVIKVPKGKTKTYKSLFQKKGLNKKIKIK
jgi:phage tail tube protein FII